MPFPHGRPLALLVALLALGVAAPTADAATIAVTGSTLTYTAEPGERNAS